MADQAEAYIERKPGDLITSEDWNTVQEMIRADIGDRISEAVEGIKKVPASSDADKLGGMGFDDLAQKVYEYVLRQLPKRTGYRCVFRELKTGEESVIDHGFGAAPLVDVYQLYYFEVVASEDGHISKEWTTFYLHNSSERTIRYKDASGTTKPLPVNPAKGHVFHIPFTDMLELYGIEWQDDQNLGDLEGEFWEKFNSDPNSNFSDDQYFHSPWWDRCCGERRSMGSLKHDLDDLIFQMRPRRTMIEIEGSQGNELKVGGPASVQVSQFDLNSIGLKLLDVPVQFLPQSRREVSESTGEEGVGEDTTTTKATKDHLKVMVLLKV